MRKTKKYNLFGIEIELSERNASDVFSIEKLYSDSVKNEKDENKIAFLQIELTIRRIIDSLKYGYTLLGIFDKLRLKRKLSVRYFINHLTLSEITEIIKILDELEGNEEKKKNQGNQ